MHFDKLVRVSLSLTSTNEASSYANAKCISALYCACPSPSSTGDAKGKQTASGGERRCKNTLPLFSKANGDPLDEQRQPGVQDVQRSGGDTRDMRAGRRPGARRATRRRAGQAVVTVACGPAGRANRWHARQAADAAARKLWIVNFTVRSFISHGGSWWRLEKLQICRG